MFVFRTLAALIAVSTIAMMAFLYLFIARNAPGFVSLAPFIVLGMIYALVYSYAALNLANALWRKPGSRADTSSAWIARLLLLTQVSLLVFAFIDNTVTGYYQPLSIFDDVILALAVGWCTLILAALYLIAKAGSVSLEVLRKTLLLCLVAVAGWPLAAALPLINSPQPGEQVSLHSDVFVGGVGGYDIYRIPGLVVLPRGARLANGTTLEQDRLIAFAEARRDAALDTGVIDLVMKTSDNGGANWSEQRVICRHAVDGIRGKCGNPTPLFDQLAGRVVLAYNLSGISQAAANNKNHSAHTISSDDGGHSWEPPRQLADDNLIFGPGHGIQKRMAPYAGRLVIPAYLQGHALALYSDDHGTSWQRSSTLNTGNETEIAELSDGRLYMTTRHNAPVGRPPEPNGRLYSISADGGSSWPDAQLDTRLATPICQASVLHYGDQGGLLFANPSHPQARVRLTVQYSSNDGASWQQQTLVYPGPAGYSVLAVTSDGDLAVLYERGLMAYSERISLALLPPRAMTTTP